MPILRDIFGSPSDRLESAIEKATDEFAEDVGRAISGLETAIDKQAGAAIDQGETQIVTDAYRTLVDLHAQAGQPSQAVQALERLRRYPFNAPVVSEIGLTLLTELPLAEGDVATVVEWVREARRLVEAIPALQKALDDRFPRSTLLTACLGDALQADGRYHDAAQRYRSVFDWRPSEGKRFLPELRTIVEKAPDDQLARETLGLIFARQKDHPEAAKHLGAALELGQLEASSLVALADAYSALEQWDKTVATLERVLDQAEEAETKVELIRRCERLSSRGAEDESSKAPVRLLQRVWADTLCRQERYLEALSHYELALEELPEDEAGRDFATSVAQRLAEVPGRTGPASAAEAYLVLGQALLLSEASEQALEAYRAGVQLDKDVTLRAIAGLQNVVLVARDLLEARLQMAKWQVETRNWEGGFQTLEAIRRDLPRASDTTIEVYDQIVSALETTSSDLALAKGPHTAAFIGSLYALAEETASTFPGQAVSHLARVLAASEGNQADEVLAQLAKLDLLHTESLTACLTQGDAYRAVGEFDQALGAYQSAPLSEQTIDRIAQRLVELAEVDQERPDALIAAASARLHINAADHAIPLLEQAFERDRDTTAPLIVEYLHELHKAKTLSPAGLALLVDALTHRGDNASLRSALDVARVLLESEPKRPEAVITRTCLIQEKVGPDTESFAVAGFLLGEAFRADNKLADAASAYATLVGHHHAEGERLISLLEGLTEDAPDVALAWLGLGDTYRQQEEPRIGDALDAYTSALRADPAKAAHAVVSRLDEMEVTGAGALQGLLLRAESAARTGQGPVATRELREALEAFDERGAEGILRVCELLPDEPDTWLLRGDVSIAQQLPDEAAHWFELVTNADSEEKVDRAQKALRELSEQYPGKPTPRLTLGRVLIRLNRTEEAAREFGEVAVRFPSARDQALGTLSKLTGPSVSLAQARAFVAEDDVSDALEALTDATSDPSTLPSALGLLRTLFDKHPRDPGVLGALTRAEIGLGTSESLDQAVTHVEAWLAADPASAEQVSDAVSQIVDALGELEIERSPLALRAHQIWVDALLEAAQSGAAAQQLRAILEGWPDASGSVVERCRQALANDEAFEIRLALIDAYIAGGELEEAVSVCEQAPYTEPPLCQAVAECCQLVVEQTQRGRPSLAARALIAQAEHSWRQGDATATADACRAAARLDPTRVDSVIAQLESWGRDELGHCTLLHACGDILRDAGPSTHDAALEVYRDILEWDLESQATQVLDALGRFPDAYLPAWHLKLDTYVRLGPEYYADVSDTAEDVLSLFEAQDVAGTLLDTCDQMRATHPIVHLLRAKIHEMAGELLAAAADLLHLQETIPDEFPQARNELADLITRHPEEHSLQMALGNAFALAGQWDAALDIYRQIQEATDELAAPLIDRFTSALEAMSESTSARWGLARARHVLAEPDIAAKRIDEIVDIDRDQALDAEEFLTELLKDYPSCGQGWFTRGKLAYRAGNHAQAIAHLEEAVRQGGVAGGSQCLLHDMLGHAHHAAGELEAALANLRRAVVYSPEEVLLREAVLNVRLDILDEAIANKQRELDDEDDPVPTLLEMTDLLLQRGDYVRATNLLQSALRQGHGRGEVHLALARCFATQRLHHLSAASLEMALAGDDLEEQERTEALYLLAVAYRRQLRYDEAVAALEEICVLDVCYRNALAMIDAIQSEKATAQSHAVALRAVSDVRPFSRSGVS